jgi:hypothetical protein
MTGPLSPGDPQAGVNQSSVQAPLRHFCSHINAISVLASVNSPRPAAASMSASLTSARSISSPSSSARAPAVRPRANQISMISVE